MGTRVRVTKIEVILNLDLSWAMNTTADSSGWVTALHLAVAEYVIARRNQSGWNASA